MGLFGKKRVELSPLLSEAEIDAGLEEAVNYDDVLDYLVGLSRAEYDKMLKVANIYRNANKDAHKVLGIKDEATVSIDKESKPEAGTDLEADIPFILEDEPVVKPKKAKKQKL